MAKTLTKVGVLILCGALAVLEYHYGAPVFALVGSAVLEVFVVEPSISVYPPPGCCCFCCCGYCFQLFRVQHINII